MPIGGIIDELRIEDGQLVKEGDLLILDEIQDMTHDISMHNSVDL